MEFVIKDRLFVAGLLSCRLSSHVRILQHRLGKVMKSCQVVVDTSL